MRFLLKNKLESEEVMELKLMGSPGTGEEDETSLAGLAGGLCCLTICFPNTISGPTTLKINKVHLGKDLFDSKN